MAKQGAAPMQHGGALLPAVEIVSYNVELKDDEGFIGDRASKGAFRDFIDSWRKPMREMGQDPFGDEINRQDREKTPGCAAVKRRCRGGRCHSRALSNLSRKSLRSSSAAF